ncbi:LuxR C-terminal-related transcriptional regulator [Microbacterium sp. A93]|uniref:LuxR C-terminal-related transcriptional regulator n=1 Tax=Microbacterium sp. A93 TaxID=3450716 RepID=UPI003F422AC6
MTGNPAEMFRPSDRDLIKSALRDLGTQSAGEVLFGGMVGRTHLNISEMFGSRTRSIVGVQVPLGSGLGGWAMRQERPVGVSDYFAAAEITHEFDQVVRVEGLWSMLAIPVVVDGTPRAVIYAATRDRVQFGDRMARTSMLKAQQVAEELKIRDEVDRRLGILRVAAASPEDDVRDLQDAVRVAHAELIALAHAHPGSEIAESVRAVAASLVERPPIGESAPRLSPRELDVLSQVALGCSYPEVAQRLSLKPGTVKSYMRTVLTKLDCTNRVEAVVTARRWRLLP